MSHDRLVQELDYYRRECNDLGARVLRLQEEQSRAFREARRSRTVARLIREAYKLVDRTNEIDEIGALMLDIIVNNTICDRAAFLQRKGRDEFAVTHLVGFEDERTPTTLVLPSAPLFFYTTSQTPMESPASELTRLLRLPYVLWAFDAGSAFALILGNRSEGNVSRPFEPGDQELIEGALSVYADIVYRKRTEGDLRAAKREADTARAAQASFLASLSHELRTPLNAIIGFSEVIRDQILGPNGKLKHQEYAAHIHDSGTHLLSLINDILDLSKLEKEGEIPLNEEGFDVTGVVDRAVRDALPIAQEKGLSVETSIPAQLPQLFADPRRIRQILTNLLSNAVKFTPSGGKIVLSTRIEDRQGLLIEIADTGIGMTAQEIPRALAPFGQIQNVYSREHKGTGLGLPICKALVELHGGSFEVASVPGQGTTVTIRLPPDRLVPSP
ncbi:sensor histidine kinase [Rhodospirillaceae bacterium SYSU D60014]|uniref:sensor histidine kinase n=1 Tax=Virgifigura deserti TaxID=2268457 RepID=UPI0013C52732